ncbi:MAG TPA: type VI secretion system-associated protein TagO [Candidimonas sp.]|nr:type VI secretion system-associated protein TagO [Candidimonas sp.]
MKRLLLALVLLPLGTHAVESEEVAACAVKQNTVERLSCFDELASRHSLAPTTVDTTGKAGTGTWVTRTSTDPMTDTSIHMAFLLAESGRSKYGNSIALVARCSNNKTEMWVDWQSYLGNRNTSVTHRVGKEKPKTASWHLSADNKATFFPTSPVALLKSMTETNSFVANVTPYNENPVTAVFDTTGAAEALADIRNDCKW